MLNFLGALQPMKPDPKARKVKERMTVLPRVCGMGQCKNRDDAQAQLKKLYKKEHPHYAKFVDNEDLCHGGVFVFDCTPYELIEKAANEESEKIIRDMYDEAIEISPFVE